MDIGPNISLIIYFLIYLWGILWVGSLCLKPFKIVFKSKIERKVYEFALGNLVYSYIFHYLGIFHLLYQPLILILYLVPLLILLKKILAGRFKLGLTYICSKFFQSRWKTTELLIFVFLLLTFGPLIPHLFAFPTAWDPLAYHLVLPKTFLHDHYFSYYDWQPNTLFPIGIESLFSFGEVVGEPRLANFIVFSFLAVFVIYILYGLRWMWPKRVLFIALFIFAFREILFSAVPVAPFVDFPLAFYTFLIAITLIKYIKNPRWATLFLLIGFSLFTFLIKYAQGFVFIFSILIVLVIHAFYNRNQVKKMFFSFSRSQKLMGSVLVTFFLLPVLYWLARNFIYTHNPIYPFLNPFWDRISPVVGYDRVDYEAQISNMKSGSLSFKMVAKILIKFLLGRSIDYPAWKEAFFGVVALIFSFLGIIHKERVVRYLAGFGILSVIPIYWLAGFPSYRYSLAAAVILAMVASIIFFNLFRRPFSWFRLPLIALFIFSFWIQFFTVAEIGYNSFRDNFERVTKGSLSYKVAVKNSYGQDNLLNISYVNHNLNKNKDKVLVVFDNRLYYFNIPAEYAIQSPSGFFTNKNTKDIEEIYKAIKGKGFTYVFVNNNWGRYGNLRTDLFDPFTEAYLQPVSTASGTIIYKLK